MVQKKVNTGINLQRYLFLIKYKNGYIEVQKIELPMLDNNTNIEIFKYVLLEKYICWNLSLAIVVKSKVWNIFIRRIIEIWIIKE